MGEIRGCHGLPQAGLGPETVGKVGIVNLETVVDPQGHAALWLSRRGGERDPAEEGDIIAGQ